VLSQAQELLGSHCDVLDRLAEWLVSDDLDTYKRVADELGLAHQICRSHVRRNVEALAEELQAPQPTVGERHPVSFRMRTLITRLWSVGVAILISIAATWMARTTARSG
jgi:hypothetical protein